MIRGPLAAAAGYCIARTPALEASLAWPVVPVLYLVVPGHPLALLPGLPLNLLGLASVMLLLLTSWCRLTPARGAARALLVALGLSCVIRAGLAVQALPYGLSATYSTSADPASPAERSTEWIGLSDATRVDSGLDFVGDRFPVHFFNDFKRFNFYTASQPRRDLLPFSVTWRGWLLSPTAGERCLRLEANGSAALRLGQASTARLAGLDRVEARDLCTSGLGGADPLEVRFSRPAGGVPYLIVRELGADGALSALSLDQLAREPVDIRRAALDRHLGDLARSLDLLVLVILATTLTTSAVRGMRGRRLPDWWERPLLATSVMSAFLESLAVQRHFIGRTPVLSGGNDWLAYATFARDLLFNGPLMTGGKPLGEGEAFYYQPLYAYFLAAVHLALGESVTWLLLTQYTLVAIAGVVCYLLARELFDRRTALITLGLFWVFRYLIFNQVAGLLLSENLVQLIVPAMLLVLVRWTRSRRRSDLVGAGLLAGLAILARTTPLLFLPPAALLIVRAELQHPRQRRVALGTAGLFVTTALMMSALMPLRNFLVAGRPVLLPESASTNIYETHRPSARVDLSRIDRDPLYARLGFDRRTREVVEFIRQDPLGYAGTLVPMGLYPLGITGPALGTNQMQYELIFLSALYITSLIAVPSARRLPALFVHAFVLTHFGQMMIFMSHQYGFRLPLPMYGPMLPLAGASLLAFGRRLGNWKPQVRGWAPQALARAAMALAIAFSGWQLTQPRDVEATVFGLDGDAAPAARSLNQTPANWRADRIYFSGLDRRSLGVAYLPGLAYRDMKWFDGGIALVWPPESLQGILIYTRAREPSLLAECWSSAARSAELASDGRAEQVLRAIPPTAERTCGTESPRLASFGGILNLLRPFESPSALELLVSWRVSQRPSYRVQTIVERISSDAGGSVLEAYPSAAWETGELVTLKLPSLDGSPEGLAIGFGRGGAGGRIPIDDPLRLYGQTRLEIRDWAH